LGSSTDLSAGDLRWLSPLPLWTGILAGPIAFAFNLTATFALVKWTCAEDRPLVLHLISFAAVLIVLGGAWISWMALEHSSGAIETDEGTPEARARFMALFGLASSAFFLLATVANAFPQWVLDACR
jgi:hypothetical protein